MPKPRTPRWRELEESLARFGTLFRQALIASYRDNILATAKGAAYSSLLAFFPVFTTLTALLVQARAAAVSRALASLLFQIVPPGSEDLVRYNFTVRGQRPTWILVGATLIAAWPPQAP